MIDPRADDDARLFARMQAGDRAAFGGLVERHKDRLVNYLTRLSGCRDTAEDLAQEAFLRLAERGGGYVEQGHLPAYLYRIATNLLRSQERRQRRWSSIRGLLFSSNGGPERPRQSARLLRRELESEVARAIAALPLRFRVPIVLYHVEGWPYRRIAELLGSSQGTVKSRIYRGRGLLRRSLAPYLEGETT